VICSIGELVSNAAIQV